MPQASKALRAKFPGSDAQAMEVLRTNFTEQRFIFQKKEFEYQPTQREWDALNYMVCEWDYGYEEARCSNCHCSYAQHTKGASPEKYCRHCPCPEWVSPRKVGPAKEGGM